MSTQLCDRVMRIVPKLIHMVANEKTITFDEETRSGVITALEEIMYSGKFREKLLENISKARDEDEDADSALLVMNTDFLPSVGDVAKKGFAPLSDQQLATLLVMPVIVGELAEEVSQGDSFPRGKWWNEVRRRHR